MNKWISILVWLFCSVSSHGQSKYTNRDFNYCVEYPAGWIHSESLSKNGALFAPKDTRPFAVVPKISVGARTNQPSVQDEQRVQTLDEIVNDTVPDLERYENAVDVRVIREDRKTLHGLPARSIAVRYTDSRTKEELYILTTNVVDNAGIVYFIELKCSPKNASELTSTYKIVVNSLSFGCGRKKE